MSCLYISTVRFTLLFVFLASGTFFLSDSANAAASPSGAGVLVTPESSGYVRTGAANNAYGVYEDLQKSAATGRVGYPSVPVANRSSMSAPAARTAMRGVWRLAGWVAVAGIAVELAGAGYNWLQCSTNQICKPSGTVDPKPNYSGGPGYCYSRWNGNFCVDEANIASAANVVGDMCASNLMCDFTTYNQTVTSKTCDMQGTVAHCHLTTSQPPSATYQYDIYVDGVYHASGNSYVNGTQSVPVTDSELESAAGARMASHPAQFIDDLKAARAWAPDKNEMSTPVSDVSGVPVLRELPETKPGAPAGNKLEKIEPHTGAKPAADAQSVNVYNYNITTTTHTDGTTEQVTDAQEPNLDIPDDYAREDTLDAIRKALTERDATPGDDGCSSQPVCSGDAISCAMLVEQYKGRCAFRNEVIPEESPVPPTETNLNTLVGTLDSGRWAGSAVCPADLTAAVNGHVLTIKMDAACSQAAFIKPIVIAAALLMAGMIIMRVE